MLTVPAIEQQQTHGARLLSYSRAIAPVDLLAFLRSAPPNEQRIYWENRDDEVAFAGYGVALELSAQGPDRFSVIKTQARQVFESAIVEGMESGIVPRLFGGFSFRADHQPGGFWNAFPAAYFILPRYLLTRSGDRAWLTINAFVNHGEESTLGNELAWMIQQIAKLRGQTSTSAHTAEDYLVHFSVNRDFWRQQITFATDRIKAGDLGKVVLSRAVDVTFPAPADPLDVMQNLRERYKDTFRFLIEPQVSNAFFGATPELLVSVNGHHLHTAALAGSIRRGKNAEEDQSLAAELLANPKELQEHAFVADALRELITPAVSKLNAPDTPRVLMLSNIQHLYTPFQGTLKPGHDVLSLVEQLHPTPALGGYPQKAAVAAIAASEPLGRGWYAAPIGWFDHEGNGMFAVAIRSGVAVDHQVRLYAGVGVVADSDPDREWDETLLKFRPVANALGVVIE